MGLDGFSTSHLPFSASCDLMVSESDVPVVADFGVVSRSSVSRLISATSNPTVAETIAY
ncbi:hypothetical protein V4B17_05235 [Bartonella sp. B23]